MVVLQALYLVVLISSLLIQFGLILFAWTRHTTPGALTFMWFMVTATFIALGYFLLAIAPNATFAYIWARLRFLGMAFLPVTYLLFVLQYVGRGDIWFKSHRYLWLLVIPVITQVVIWTNGHHQAFFSSWSIEKQELLSVETSTFGPWYDVHAIYGYLLVIAGFWILASTLVRAKGIYRRQVLLLLIGSLAAILASLPAALGFMKPPYNTFPLGSIIAGMGLIPLRPPRPDPSSA
jgi:hypothetical protein